MKWVGVAALLWAAWSVPASAAGYDDFTAGMTADLRGEYETAVTAFSAALASPDLIATYRPAAYRGRAQAYLNLDKCPEAMADIQAFEALKKADRSVLRLRVWVNLCLKNAEAARKDLDLVNKGKLDWDDLWSFARLEWRYGLFDTAAATAHEAFVQADKKDSDTAYVLLWEFLNELRAGKFDPVVATRSLAEVKYSGWPRPVFDLYLGKLNPAELQAKSASFFDATTQSQRCEANFYTAEWHLGRNDSASAKPLLIDVNANCPSDFLERWGARSELKRLGVPLPKE